MWNAACEIARLQMTEVHVQRAAYVLIPRWTSTEKAWIISDKTTGNHDALSYSNEGHWNFSLPSKDSAFAAITRANSSAVCANTKLTRCIPHTHCASARYLCRQIHIFRMYRNTNFELPEHKEYAVCRHSSSWAFDFLSLFSNDKIWCQCSNIVQV